MTSNVRMLSSEAATPSSKNASQAPEPHSLGLVYWREILASAVEDVIGSVCKKQKQQ